MLWPCAVCVNSDDAHGEQISSAKQGQTMPRIRKIETLNISKNRVCKLLTESRRGYVKREKMKLLNIHRIF